LLNDCAINLGFSKFILGTTFATVAREKSCRLHILPLENEYRDIHMLQIFAHIYSTKVYLAIKRCVLLLNASRTVKTMIMGQSFTGHYFSQTSMSL
jgi:hypothetical protein